MLAEVVALTLTAGHACVLVVPLGSAPMHPVPTQQPVGPGPNFIELPTKFPCNFQNKQTSAEQMEIWLVILFLSREKLHAEQISC